MIISKTDIFLFQKMGMMLLASGHNKSSLRAGIQKMNEHLNHAASSDERYPNYVWIKRTPELINNIDKVFNDTFIGCDTVWEDINVEVKFAIIISTFWNRCFNSLWKLRIAAINENSRESDGISRSSLPTAVREYEDPALRALAKSIMNCSNDASPTTFGREADLRQSLESSRKEIELLRTEAQSDLKELEKRFADTKQLLEIQESAINSLNRAIMNDTEEKALQSLKELEDLPRNFDHLRNALCNLLNNLRNNESSQQQASKEMKELESQLAEKSKALQQYQPSELTVAVPGGRVPTWNELMTENKEVKAQLKEIVESTTLEKESWMIKEHAIDALNQALTSGSEERILEALDALETLPEDVDHVKNALWDSLSAQKQLEEKKKELESRLTETSEALKQYQPPQSTVALPGEKTPTYAELMNECRQIHGQVTQYQQKDVAIAALNQAVASGSGERVLEALNALETLPEDVDHVKNALRDSLSAQEQLKEQKKDLELRLAETSEALDQYQPPQSTVALPGEKPPTYAELMNEYRQIRSQVNQYKQKDAAIGLLNQALVEGSGERVLASLNAVQTFPEDVNRVKTSVLNLLNAQKQLSEENEELKWRLVQTSTALQQYEPSQSSIAVPGEKMPTYAELMNEYRQIQGQINQYQQKDVAIAALNQAVTSGSGERVLEALDALKSLPEDVNYVKNALLNWLNVQKQLSEENEELKLRLTQTSTALQQYEPSQSTIAVPGERIPTYAELMNEYRQIQGQINQYQQKDVAIAALNQAVASGSEERVLEALDALKSLPEDVYYVKNALLNLLSARKQMIEEKNKLESQLMVTRNHLQRYGPSQLSVAAYGESLPLYEELMTTYNGSKKLQEALGSGDGESTLAALDQLGTLPEHVNDVKNALYDLLQYARDKSVDSERGGEDQPLAIEYSHR